MKKICAVEVFRANVLKIYHLSFLEDQIIHVFFLLIAWNNRSITRNT